MNVVKGSRVRARWLATRHVGLAGAQVKFEGTWREVKGTVRHVRGDHPTAPTAVRLYLDAEGEAGTVTPEGCTCGPHIEVDPKHVVEVL